MRKSELTKLLAARINVSQNEANEILLHLADIIHNEMINGGEVSLPNVGKFKVRKVSARVGRNPKNGEILQIPAKRKVYFSCGKELKNIPL